MMRAAGTLIVLSTRGGPDDDPQTPVPGQGQSRDDGGHGGHSHRCSECDRPAEDPVAIVYDLAAATRQSARLGGAIGQDRRGEHWWALPDRGLCWRPDRDGSGLLRRDLEG